MKYDSHLLAYFREFYIEVVRLKQMIRTGRGHDLEDEDPGQEENIHEELSGYIRSRLLTKMEESAFQISEAGGEFSGALRKDTQYAMTALADEIFLNEDWEEKEIWKLNLLEHKVFGTKIAGDEFFTKIDKLLEERDPAFAELALIYFLALANGFQGKYKNSGREIELGNYRARLYVFIYQRKPVLLSDEKRLFHEASDYTLSEGIGYSIPYLKKWIIIISGLSVSLIIASHFLWDALVDDLDGVIDKILN